MPIKAGDLLDLFEMFTTCQSRWINGESCCHGIRVDQCTR